MACGGGARAMSRSLVATARSAARACRASGSEAMAGGVKARSPCAPSCAPSSGSFFRQTRRPASFLFRLPGEVACVQSLLPLHSATASSRLVAQLSTTAGALLQELSKVWNHSFWLCRASARLRRDTERGRAVLPFVRIRAA